MQSITRYMCVVSVFLYHFTIILRYSNRIRCSNRIYVHYKPTFRSTRNVVQVLRRTCRCWRRDRISAESAKARKITPILRREITIRQRAAEIQRRILRKHSGETSRRGGIKSCKILHFEKLPRLYAGIPTTRTRAHSPCRKWNRFSGRNIHKTRENARAPFSAVPLRFLYVMPPRTWENTVDFRDNRFPLVRSVGLAGLSFRRPLVLYSFPNCCPIEDDE